MVNPNFSCAIVEVDDENVTLTYDLSSLQDAEEKKEKIEQLMEDLAFEGDVQVLDDQSDEEDEWVILNIELNTNDHSDNEVKDFIRKVDSF